MANILCYVDTGSDDGTIGTDASTTRTTLWMTYDIIDDIIDYSWAKINTSAVTSANIITAATLYWYHVSYTKDVGTDPRRIISFSGGSTILDTIAAAGLAGWKNCVLDSSILSEIDKNGKTTVVFDVGSDAPDYIRAWTIRSKNYSGGAMGPYLSIDYDPATVAVTTGFIIRT